MLVSWQEHHLIACKISWMPIFNPARRAACVCLKVKHNAVRGKKGKVVDLRQQHMALAEDNPSHDLPLAMCRAHIRRIWLWRGVFPGDVQLHTGLHLHRYCCRVLCYHPIPSLVPPPSIPYRHRQTVQSPTFLVAETAPPPTICEWEPTPTTGYCGAFGEMILQLHRSTSTQRWPEPWDCLPSLYL